MTRDSRRVALHEESPIDVEFGDYLNHDTGARVRDLPIRPDRLISALGRCNR
jgi:hypothetical protein